MVYDLQSGTLFKKWKPGRDTASLAISSADGCVVSGLDDARILVWDLVTGTNLPFKIFFISQYRMIKMKFHPQETVDTHYGVTLVP